jgi:hypothetical protein
MEIIMLQKAIALLIITYSAGGYLTKPNITINSLNTSTIERLQETNNKTITPVRDIVASIQSGKFNKRNTPLFVNIKDKHDKSKIIEIIKVTPGIAIDEHDKWMTLVCRGGKSKFYRRIRGFLVSYGALRFEMLTTNKVVTFDYFDSLCRVSYGQKQDIDSIKIIYENILEKNLNLNIILFGECMGTISMLNFVEQSHLQNVKGIVMIMPAISLKHVAYRLPKQWFNTSILNNKVGQYLIHGVLSFGLLHYNPITEYNLFKKIKNIKNQKIILHHLVDKDHIVDNNGIIELINLLNNNKTNIIYLNLITDKNIFHETVVEHKSVKLVNHAFYKNIDAPYNEEYAQEGKKLFEQARAAGKDPVTAFLALTDQIDNKYKK